MTETPGARFTTRRTEIAWLAVILMVASILRMGWPSLTEFKADEARLAELALDMAEGLHFPVRGISSSVGLPNPPMSVWLYALPLFLWKHVYSATLFTGLLNTLSVLGCWWFTRRFWGKNAALATALLWAVSPWGVFYSRKIWAQNLLPLFVMLWAISAALTFVERRPRYILLHVASLAVVAQIHMAAVALVPATIIFMLLFWKRLNWKLVGLGGGLAALTALPFVVHWISAGLGLDSVLETSQRFGGGLDLTSLQYTWLISLGRDLHVLAGPEAVGAFLSSVPTLTPVQWLIGGLILAGLSWLGWGAWKRRGDQAAEAGLLVLVWALVPSLFFLWHSSPVFPHYMIPTFPAQYIAAGVAFGALARRWPWPSWIMLSTSATGQALVWGLSLSFLSAQATPGGFGTPLSMQLEAAELAHTMLVEEAAGEVLLAGRGEPPALDEFAAVYSVLLRSTPHRYVNTDRSLLLPTSGTIVLLSEAPTALGERYLGRAARIVPVQLRAGEGTRHVLSIPEGTAFGPELTFAQPAPLANGITLLGNDRPRQMEDGTAQWQITWTAGQPSELDYHFFNHLIDGQGAQVSQADAAAFGARQWRQGDTVISQFTLPWPADAVHPLTMRTGMYTYPEIENVPVLDAAGLPYSDAVEIEMPPEQ